MWLCGLCGFCGSCVSNTRETSSTSRFARFWSLWFLCGSCVGGFVVFGHVWFLGLVCASDPPHVVFVDRWSCPPARCRCPWSARPLIDGLCGSVVLPSMPMPTVARMSCASTCSLWSAKKICPLPNFVLCSVSSPLEATFTNGENDHG